MFFKNAQKKTVVNPEVQKPTEFASVNIVQDEPEVYEEPEVPKESVKEPEIEVESTKEMTDDDWLEREKAKIEELKQKIAEGERDLEMAKKKKLKMRKRQIQKKKLLTLQKLQWKI